jgi:hypothetical protein
VDTVQNSGPCRLRWLAVAFAALLASNSALWAQSAPLAERLPEDTILCAEWRGTAFLSGADQKNHVLQLIEDPAFAPGWFALAANFQRAKQKPGGLEFSDVLSLLKNPIVFGVAALPQAPASSASDDPPSPFGFFAVYDSTGQTTLIDKWKASVQNNSNTKSAVTAYDFSGTRVEVRGTGPSTAYSAQVSNYFLASNQKEIIEGLIARFRGADHSAKSLGQLTAYRDLQKFIGPDAAFSWYARIPDVDQWKIPPASRNTAAQFAKSLHLEKIHTAGAGISFAGEAMHVRGAVLGDTSSPAIFDLAGPSTTAFQTQPVVNGTSTFSMSRFNMGALYALVREGIAGSLTGQQGANINAMEAVGQSYLGMPIPDALGLFTGEVASFSTYSDDGTPEQLFAASIQQPKSVLRILRAVAGPMIVAEDSFGTATLLDISYPYKDPKTGTQRRKFYYLAVTPQMFLGAPRKAMLRQTIQRLGAQSDPSAPAGVLANPEFLQMRSLLPEKLSGLSGSDLTQIPWDKLFTNLENQIPQGANQKNGAQQLPDLHWLKPETISRHLHLALSGWWKDPGGVYFDSYVQ